MSRMKIKKEKHSRHDIYVKNEDQKGKTQQRQYMSRMKIKKEKHSRDNICQE
jgi:hypothetical protein